MCGIAGSFAFDPAAHADAALLARMTAFLAHRGPDDAGHYVEGPIALGHRRLSIIDLSPAGHQPMSNADGTVWITYNGECYNHPVLAAALRAKGYRFRSSSDTETLLHLYEEYGVDFLHRIEGMFALALWDARRHTLLLARDRLGIKPLVYYCDARHLVFASELKALLADPAVPSAVDLAALGDYFHLMSIPDPRSIHPGVRKLEPGHCLLASHDGVRDLAWWDLDRVVPDEAMTLPEACEELERRLRRSVAAHLLADVPVGAFLSGGVDSSTVVAFAGRGRAMATFSSVSRGHEEFDESAHARRVAELCDTDHHEVDVRPDLVDVLPRIAWHADEPFAISSALAVYSLAEAARGRVKVVLTGDGSDELFAGYPWRHADGASLASRAYSAWRRVNRVLARQEARGALLASARRALARARNGIPPGVGYAGALSCYRDDDLEMLLEAEVAAAVRTAWAVNTIQSYYDRYPGLDPLSRKLFTDVKSTLVSEMLTKLDRMTMAVGLEARVPFLDHTLVEWAFTVPARHKLRGREGKILVKALMERYLPRDLLYRPKHGFNVPLRIWMRGSLREFVRDLLAPDRLRRRGLVRPEAVTRMLADHEAGRGDASNRIFVLLMLELWFQQFVDDRSALRVR